jgi:hypothetical protein
MLWKNLPGGKIKKLAIPVLLICLVLGIARLLDPNLFGDSQRILLFKRFIPEWWNNYNIYIGSGIGSFPYVSINLQDKLHWWNDGIFLWMHSDWGQLLIEGGIVGLALSIALFVDVFRRLYKSTIHVSSLCGFSAAMVFNYPMRYVMVFVLCYLILIAYTPKIECLGKTLHPKVP